MIALLIQLAAANTPPKMVPVKFPINPLLVIGLVAGAAIFYYLLDALLPQKRSK